MVIMIIYTYIYIYYHAYIYRGYTALRLNELQRLSSPKIEGKWGYPAQRLSVGGAIQPKD